MNIGPYYLQSWRAPTVMGLSDGTCRGGGWGGGVG